MRPFLLGSLFVGFIGVVGCTSAPSSAPATASEPSAEAESSAVSAAESETTAAETIPVQATVDDGAPGSKQVTSAAGIRLSDPTLPKQFADLTVNSKGKVELSPEDWKKRLTDDQFYVAREHGTEYSFRNAYWDNKKEGVYRCIGCGQKLFDSSTKYKSGTGWPSFWDPIDPKAVATQTDRKFFSIRTEVHCSRCESHLGHVFEDGPKPTGLRYCMNSAAMLFVPAKTLKSTAGSKTTESKATASSTDEDAASNK